MPNTDNSPHILEKFGLLLIRLALIAGVLTIAASAVLAVISPGQPTDSSQPKKQTPVDEEQDPDTNVDLEEKRRQEALAAILEMEKQLSEPQKERRRELLSLIQDSSLDLSGQKITDDELRYLQLATIKALDLSHTDISDAGITYLKGIPTLTWLDVTNTKITDASLAQLKELTKLTWLSLSKTQITDAGMAHLEQLTWLHRLDLSWTAVGDDSLQYLAPMSNLDWLNLRHTKVSDAGLQHLIGLKKLSWIGLKGTQVSEKGIAEFKQAFPGCNVYY